MIFWTYKTLVLPTWSLYPHYWWLFIKNLIMLKEQYVKISYLLNLYSQSNCQLPLAAFCSMTVVCQLASSVSSAVSWTAWVVWVFTLVAQQLWTEIFKHRASWLACYFSGYLCNKIHKHCWNNLKTVTSSHFGNLSKFF